MVNISVIGIVHQIAFLPAVTGNKSTSPEQRKNPRSTEMMSDFLDSIND